MQNKLMKFSPIDGLPKPYPSHAEQWRRFHGDVAWLVNPWTGEIRNASDVGSDVFGKLISEKDNISTTIVGDNSED